MLEGGMYLNGQTGLYSLHAVMGDLALAAGESVICPIHGSLGDPKTDHAAGVGVR